jgi:hypothetical protein
LVWITNILFWKLAEGQESVDAVTGRCSRGFKVREWEKRQKNGMQ